MHDFPAMEVVEAGEDLKREIGESELVRDVSPLKRSTVHVLQQHLDFAGVVVHVVALHHVGVIHISEDLDFSTDLAEHVVVVVSVDHLQGVQPPRRPVEDLVHGAAATASDSVDSLQLRERWRRRRRRPSGGRRLSRRRRKRKRHGKGRIPLRERKREVGPPSRPNPGIGG